MDPEFGSNGALEDRAAFHTEVGEKKRGGASGSMAGDDAGADPADTIPDGCVAAGEAGVGEAAVPVLGGDGFLDTGFMHTGFLDFLDTRFLDTGSLETLEAPEERLGRFGWRGHAGGCVGQPFAWACTL